jgi:ATP-dependent helicase HrpB
MSRSLQLALPIDEHLPRIVAELERARSLVLQAEPGAGKTTRVPAAVLEAGARGAGGMERAGEVLVLEPRRIAAKLSAERVADEQGWRLGETVGYQFRFENVTGPRTRLRFLTEGMLMRRLVDDPTLKGVATVILDEFHERHLQGDLALAVVRRIQRELRPELKILVMSATLETESLARYLGDGSLSCPVMRVPGRTFEVSVEYLGHGSAQGQPGTGLLGNVRDLDLRVRDAVRRVEGAEGDILVFLPGMGEIRRCQERLESEFDPRKLLCLPLHGELSREEQDRALAAGGPRKVILATNVAETSITLPGVRTVVDSGLHRQASWSGWSGLPVLRTRAISRASAIQRAGRAGRTAPGVCLRLYSKGEFESRAPFDTPEVLRADLCQSLLELVSLGVGSVRDFEWLETPGATQLEQADRLLFLLGAWSAESSTERRSLSKFGQELVRLPVHPRVGRLLLEGRRLGVGSQALDLAALISEGADLGGDLLETMQRGGALMLRERGVARMRDRLVRALERKAGAASTAGALASPGALARTVLAGFPDRVGRRRGRELVLSSGGAAVFEQAEHYSAAQEFFVAVDLEEKQGAYDLRGKSRVHTVCPISADWLLDLEPGQIEEDSEAVFGGGQGRLEEVSRLRFGALVLSESRGPVADPDRAARLLARALLKDATYLQGQGGFQELQRRLAFIETHAPEAGLGPLSGAGLEEALLGLCYGQNRLEDVRSQDLGAFWAASLPVEKSRLLERLAPASVSLARGRKVRVNYEAQQPPWIESRLQDFFGMKKGPSVLDGRIPLTLHLLAPNQRAVQVTSDLEGFWVRVYPDLRRELGRRYPRHAWPENPLALGT